MLVRIYFGSISEYRLWEQIGCDQKGRGRVWMGRKWIRSQKRREVALETSKQARIKVRPMRLPRDITYIFPLLSVILILKTIKKWMKVMLNVFQKQNSHMPPTTLWGENDGCKFWYIRKYICFQFSLKHLQISLKMHLAERWIVVQYAISILIAYIPKYWNYWVEKLERKSVRKRYAIK